MDVDSEGRITGFLEKPAQPPGIPGQEHLALASMGIYVCNAEFLYDVDAGLDGATVPPLVDAGLADATVPPLIDAGGPEFVIEAPSVLEAGGLGRTCSSGTISFSADTTSGDGPDIVSITSEVWDQHGRDRIHHRGRPAAARATNLHDRWPALQ